MKLLTRLLLPSLALALLCLFILGWKHFTVISEAATSATPQNNQAKPVSTPQQTPQNGNSASAANESLWTDETEQTALSARRRIIPQRARTLKLNLAAFEALRQRVPREFTSAAKQNPVIISLPLPDKGFAEFRLEESSIMAPELAAKFPEIKSYIGQGISDPTATLRCDFTPRGFHAQIIAEKGTVLIDPYAEGDTEHYISYWRKDYRQEGEEKRFQCLVQETGQPVLFEPTEATSQTLLYFTNSGTLRTYRLAVAATVEYTAFSGGTVALALAAINTTMVRVNGVYEREVGVRMILVANNNLIIYTAEPDPYTNGTPGTMIAENQTNADTVIGAANYDIGHVFGTNSGGLASAGVCNAANKGRGVTGSGSPAGDAFDIDYVAHEMGHQFGASHTFNDGTTSNCGGGNRSANSAYEPGSGTTIMAYAGICGAANAQRNTSNMPAYFHARSLEQIINFMTSSATCSTNIATGNNVPTVSAGADFTVPRNTPFTLTATGSDPDGDPLTFCWEEYDLGAASPPEADDGSRPIYRSYPPTANTARTFPSLSYILNNANVPPATITCPDSGTGTCISGEVLHSMARNFNFRVTARDNRAAGGAVNCDTVQITVDSDSSAFAVTAPGAGSVNPACGTLNVAWSVGGTNVAPINTANVRILLSLDNGASFPLVLAASTPNDGAEAVTLPPNVASTQARVRIEAIGNIYFDISAAFTLQQQIDMAMTMTDAPDPVVAGTNLVYTINVTNNGPCPATNVQVPVTLPAAVTLTGNTAPAGWSLSGTTFTKPTMASGETAQLTVTVLVAPCTVAGAILNASASANASEVDTNTGNSGASVQTTVTRQADLVLTANTDAPDPVIAGTNLTYTITAVNNGPSCALNMNIADNLPANVRFLTAVAPGATTVTNPPVGSTGLVQATWAGDTSPGTQRSLTITVRVCAEVACNTIISNTVTTASDSPDPNPLNNMLSASTTVQAQSDLALAVTALPNPVIAGQNVTLTYTVTNGGPSNSVNTVLSGALPKGFMVVSATTTLGTITTTPIDPVTLQVSLTANLGTVGAANQCTTNFPTIATVTIVANVPKKYPATTVSGTATVTTGNCLPDPNLANNSATSNVTVVPQSNDPGAPYLAASAVSDTKAGSVLVYNLMSSSAAAPNQENTRVSLTNISGTEKTYVHLFFVDGSSCSVADAYVCLTPNQTASFLASDLDPGTTGYLIAVATDGATGLPAAFNCLIGDEFVKLSSGHAANLAAEAFSAVMYAPAGIDLTASTATLRFDGMNYTAAPRALALSNFGSIADGNAQHIVVNRFGGSLVNNAGTLGSLFGLLYDDAEKAFSFSISAGRCQFRDTLSGTFPRTTPRVTQVVPAGRTGWLKLWADSDVGILGSAINFNANAGTNSGAFNQGRNLHKLTLTNSATMVMPVFAPSC